MINILRPVRLGGFLLIVFCLFSLMNPIRAQWIYNWPSYQANIDPFSFAISGTTLFVGGQWIYRSTDFGTTWTYNNLGGINDKLIYSFVVSGKNLYAGGGRVYLSDDNGKTWSALTDSSLWALNLVGYTNEVGGTNLFLQNLDHLYLSIDNGTSWTEIDKGLPRMPLNSFTASCVSGTNLFVATFNFGVYRSTDNGTNWTAFNNGMTNSKGAAPTLQLLASLPNAAGGTNLFAAAGSSVWLSTDNGIIWSLANNGLPLTTVVYAFAISGMKLFAGTDKGVYLSTNNGTYWTPVNAGLIDPEYGGDTPYRVQALAVFGTNLIAGTGAGLWSRPLSEMFTSVERLSADLPTHFSLEQNYPNPFNPSTTIPFNLPSRSFVSLKLYDALGREVSTLLYADLSAGKYSQQWNAAKMPNGIYFYRLQAGSFTETKKLVLLK